MKLNERHTRLAIGALYYAEIALCFTLKPPQAAGFAAAVLLPLAMQLLSAIGSRQWNCLAAAFTLMPAGAVAGSIACASAPLQVSLLKAILDGHVKFTSAEVIEEYRLNSSANVRRLKDALCKKEIVYFDESGKPQIIDPLFEYWVRRYYFGMKI